MLKRRGAPSVAYCLLLAGALLAGCSRRPAAPVLYKETRELMGTYVSVSLYPPEGASGPQLADKAFQAIDEVDRLMSDYKPDSELSQVNRAAGGQAVPVSKKLYNVIVRAAYFSRLSGGAFEPTIRPLVALWRDAAKAGKLPDAETIQKVRSLVDWQQISLLAWTDREPAFTVQLTQPGMELDLGGIAKGYAVGQAIEALKAAGVSSALVAAAGDIYAMGTHPDGRAWTVAIQSPTDESQLLPNSLLLKDQAVSTSGDYRRYVEIEGHRYSHIIDPHTGRPVERMASVTVVAPNPTDADALATALSVLGPEKGLEMIRDLPGTEAMFIEREPDGQLRTSRSEGFAAFEAQQPAK